MWGKPFHLIDLTQMTDEDLLNQGDMGVLQYALKHIWATRYDEHLRQILRGLVVSEASQEGSIRLLRILLQYVESRANISKDGFIECLKEATVDDNVRSEVMTVLEQMKQEGLQEGIVLGEKKAMAALSQVKEEGIVEGQRKVALQMLRAGLSIGQVVQWTGLVEAFVQELAEEAGAPIN